MFKKILYKKEILIFVISISTLILLADIATVRISPRVSQIGKHLETSNSNEKTALFRNQIVSRRKLYEDISSLTRKHSRDSITTEAEDLLELLKRDGHQPVPLTRICQYESKPRTRPTTTIPTRIPTWPFSATFRPTPKRAKTGLSSTTVRTTSAGKRSELLCEEIRYFDPAQSNVRVPNVVHYVFIGTDFQFKFITYLSVLSAHRFLKPDQIFIHGNVVPSGKWWNATVDQVTNIYHVPLNYSDKAPNGQPFKFMAHASDYIRAELLVRYGGIYLDPDVLVLKSFDPLRNHNFVLGRESGDSLGNGIILARRGAPFLRMMLEQYWSYTGPNEEWAKQSVHQVHTLAIIYPHLLHVEETSLNRPNWMERGSFYEGTKYDWRSGNYAVHLWLRLWPKEKVPNELKDVEITNTTIGEVAQHILQSR